MIGLNNFLNDSGRVSSTKSTEKWVRKNFPDEFQKIKKHSQKISLSPRTFSEEIYHYINDLKSPVTCKGCGEKQTKFSGLLFGYLDYCSSKCSNSSNDVKNKKEKTYLNKYGVNNPSKSDTVIQKIQDTFKEKYGGNPFKLEKFQNMIKETNLKKYGSTHPLKRNSKLRDLRESKIIDQFIKKYDYLEIVEFDTSKEGDVKIKCNKCQDIFSISKWNLHQRTRKNSVTDICTICNPIGSSNDTEIEGFVREYLKSRNIEFKEKDRKILHNKEIDFYIKEKKIGIETNGLYWHSEKFKNKNYHLEKTELADRGNILLIQIFEDEIINNSDLVISRLSSLLGLNTSRIFARQCKVKEVNREESSRFINENHIQGNAGCKIRLGLYYNNKLVSIMTFGDLRKNLGSRPIENHWELVRFCSSRNITVIGGASKLLDYFIQKYYPEKIISYCDRRWSGGKFYEKLGFKLESKTRPNYYYVKNGLRENRFKYRKDILISQGFDPDKSESEIMSERGFLRIYDCGNYKFVWDKKNDPV